MYIALKWLICLSITMWLSICYIEINTNLYTAVSRNYKNETQGSSTIHRYQQYTESYEPNGFVILNYAMFLAGAIVVILYYRKHEIISFLKVKVKETKPYICHLKEYIQQIDLKSIAKGFIDATCTQIIRLVGKIKAYRSTIKELANKKATESKHDGIKTCILLVLKLSATEKQKNKISQLLFIAVQENKNLRKRFQLELVTKNRLLKHIADTQNATKETKEKLVSLQNLYLTANQDNAFYKTHLEQITIEKEESDKTLIELIKRVYQTMNLELIGYSIQLIDKAKKNLSSDVTNEISKLFTNYQTGNMTPNPKQSQQVKFEQIGEKFLEKCEPADILKFDEEETTGAREYNSAQGERILAVQDKDGLIDKIYEFKYGSDYDNGDMIRRIREYSVYCDKDCYLDYKNSRTIIDQRTNCTPSMRNYDVIGCNKFLTDSKLFQKFLQDNKITVPVKPRIANLTKIYAFRNAPRIDN